MKLKSVNISNLMRVIVCFACYTCTQRAESSQSICASIKHGLTPAYFTDEINATEWSQLTTCQINVCATSPCDRILNAQKSSCNPVKPNLFATDFECKCVENFFWSSTLKQCILNADPCLSESRCGGPIRAEGCKILNGAIVCLCRPEWMGLNCEVARDACKKNYFAHLNEGDISCSPNGKCVGCIKSDYKLNFAQSQMESSRLIFLIFPRGQQIDVDFRKIIQFQINF